MIQTIQIIQKTHMIQMFMLIWITEDTHQNKKVILKKGISKGIKVQANLQMTKTEENIIVEGNWIIRTILIIQQILIIHVAKTVLMLLIIHMIPIFRAIQNIQIAQMNMIIQKIRKFQIQERQQY